MRAPLIELDFYPSILKPDLLGRHDHDFLGVDMARLRKGIEQRSGHIRE